MSIVKVGQVEHCSFEKQSLIQHYEESVVNSEHRFAFFSKSDIKKGEELVFNYGEGYWKQQQH